MVRAAAMPIRTHDRRATDSFSIDPLLFTAWLCRRVNIGGTRFRNVSFEVIEGWPIGDFVTGVGGTQTFDSLAIPEVIVGIGLAEVLLSPATITLQRIGGIGGDCCVGNAGEDLLKQAGFTIDFSAMTLGLSNAKH